MIGNNEKVNLVRVAVVAETTAPVFPDLAPAEISCFTSAGPLSKSSPGVVS